MGTTGFVLMGIGLVFMALAMLIIDRSIRNAASETALDRLDHAIRHKKKTSVEDDDPLKKKFLPRWFTDALISAGIQPERRTLTILGAALLLPALVVFLINGPLALMGMLMIEILAGLLLVLSRQRTRKKKIIEQLPGFIDGISRISSVGYSLNIAYNQAVELAEQPLRNVLTVAVDMQQAGLELDQAWHGWVRSTT